MNIQIEYVYKQSEFRSVPRVVRSSSHGVHCPAGEGSGRASRIALASRRGLSRSWDEKYLKKIVSITIEVYHFLPVFYIYHGRSIIYTRRIPITPMKKKVRRHDSTHTYMTRMKSRITSQAQFSRPDVFIAAFRHYCIFVFLHSLRLAFLMDGGKSCKSGLCSASMTLGKFNDTNVLSMMRLLFNMGNKNLISVCKHGY